MKPKRRPIGHLDRQDKADNHMPDNDDREIGRRVVRTMMMQLFTAMGTLVDDFQVLMKETADARRPDICA